MLTADPLKLSNKLNTSRKNVQVKKQVTSPTQKRAKQLLDREHAIEKTSRLFLLLNQQYLARYGTKAKVSDVNDAITAHIRDFLENYGNPNGDELKSLENDVRDIGLNYRSNLAMNAAAKKQQEIERREEERQVVIKAERDAYIRPHLTHDQTTQWNVLNTLQTMNYEEKCKEDKLKSDMKTMKYREALGRQMVELEERHSRDLEEKKKNANEIERLSQQSAIDEERKRGLKTQKFHTDREIIREQIRERNEKRQFERSEAIESEKREMLRARRLVEEEELERQREKERQKEAHDRLLLENEKDRAYKKIVQEKQRIEDQRMQAEYEAKLKREEELRSTAFQNRLKHLSNIGDAFATGAGKVERENREREERQMLEAVRQKELSDLEKEEEKRRRLHKNTMDAKRANERLVEQKYQRIEREKEEAQRLRERYANEAAAVAREEADAVAKKKEAARKMKQKLDEQVAFVTKGKTRTAKEALSGTELKINQDIIRKIENDPDLQEKIIRRINAPVSNRDSSFKYG